METSRERAVDIVLDGLTLPGLAGGPAQPRGLVIFVHGSGSSRHSVRNKQVAAALQQRGFATLLFDLLTEGEDGVYETRFDIPLLTERLRAVAAWVRAQRAWRGLPLAYFGASTGAAAALDAAAGDPGIAAVISRGGRPDLAMGSLARVRAPTLLIVGGADAVVLSLNERAYDQLRGPRHLAVVPRATHLFEETGALDRVAQLAGDWLEKHCARSSSVAAA